MSGKAVKDAVPPAGTAIREMSWKEESEGHLLEFAASFVAESRSICRSKMGNPFMQDNAACK